MRNQISALGLQKRAANLLPRAADNEREVCVTAGKDDVSNFGGAQQTSRISRERFAQDATASIGQDVAKFTNFRRIDQTMDTYLMEFDMIREQAES